jgi:hypothetical protein
MNKLRENRLGMVFTSGGGVSGGRRNNGQQNHQNDALKPFSNSALSSGLFHLSSSSRTAAPTSPRW